MADSSFDVVSKVDKMEADNAVNQARKEVDQRYDFKNVGASVEWSGEKVLLKANTEERVKDGIEQDAAKKISKLIRDEAPKSVKAQIQGDELRVSSKSRDDLQATMALLKGADLDVALQFVNMR